MKPLASAEFVLTWLCLYPPDASTSIWKRRLFIAFTTLIITVQFIGITAGIVFVTKFISIELEKCLFVSFVIFCHACTVYMAFVAFLLRKQIPNIFRDLSDIYNQCKILFQIRAFYTLKIEFNTASALPSTLVILIIY